MTDERLTAVAEPELRETLLFARANRDPVTADEAAAHFGIHRNVARARLDRLADSGLLDVAFERRTGRSGPGAGRPAKVYAVAPELEAIEFPRRRYEQLVGALLDALPQRGRTRALRAAGEAFGRDLAEAAGLSKARSVREGLEQMCDAVARLGFQASIVEAGQGRAVIATPTCPLRPIVAARPEAAEVDRGMWAGLVERAIRGVRAETVACETQSCTDGHASCRVVLRLRQEARASGETARR